MVNLPHNQRDLEIDGSACVDDAVSDGGAVDNAAENVHQNRLKKL